MFSLEIWCNYIYISKGIFVSDKFVHILLFNKEESKNEKGYAYSSKFSAVNKKKQIDL